MHCALTDSWNHWLRQLPDDTADIYFSEEYVKLYENNGVVARCFVAHEEDNILLIPLLISPVPGYNGRYDFETAYGYGGPVTNSQCDTFHKKAERAFLDTLKNNNIIAGLIRFHPLLHNHTIFDNCIETTFDRKTVYVPLDIPEEEIWEHQIHTKHRNVIRKAQAQCTFIADYAWHYLEDFIDIYRATMETIDADAFYLFERSYFERFREALRENSFLGMVFHQEQPIAGAIFMYSQQYGHYHLAGSRHDALAYYPNNFLIYRAIGELKKRGITKFHLGGGFDRDPGNTLYKFKKRFSKEESSFYIGKVVADREHYTAICDAWKKQNPGKAKALDHIILKYRF